MKIFFSHANLNLKKGFTIIELLVVISIIALFTSITFAALTIARTKASDSKIKAELFHMRSQAEFYNGSGTAFTAATPCVVTTGTLFDTANNGLGNLFSAITIANTRCARAAGLPINGVPWAVSSIISTGAWCVDSTGASRDKQTDGVTLYNTSLTNVISATSCL